jgi:hypothetical protein
MFDAGLRIIKFGYYGCGEVYDSYVGKKGAWDQFEAAVSDARDRYKQDLQLHMSYVLNTRTRSPSELSQAWHFAKRNHLFFHVDLVHYYRARPCVSCCRFSTCVFCGTNRVPRIRHRNGCYRKLSSAGGLSDSDRLHRQLRASLWCIAHPPENASFLGTGSC